jgi:hypothetical protein
MSSFNKNDTLVLSTQGSSFNTSDTLVEDVPQDVYAGIDDQNEVLKKSNDSFDTSLELEIPLQSAEEIVDLSGGKPEKVGLLERGFKGFLNKAFVQPVKNILKSGGIGAIDTDLKALAEINRIKEEEGRSVSAEELVEIVNVSKVKVEKEVQAKLPSLQVPPPEGKAEKAVELATGLGAFVTKLAIARRVVGGTGAASEIAAFEAVNLADDGTPGMGVAMASSLGLVGNIPAATVGGKLAKLGGQGGLLAGITAAEGGSPEDVAVAFFLPSILSTLNQFPALVKGKAFDIKTAKDVQARLPFMRDVPLKDIRKWSAAMRDAVKVKAGQMTPKRWGGKHGKNLTEFSNKAKQAFDAVNKQSKGIEGAIQKAPVKPANVTPSPPTEAIVPRPPTVAKPAIEVTKAPKPAVSKPPKIEKAKEAKVAAKEKEAKAIEKAEVELKKKTQPSEAVRPVKILTKQEAESLQESNLVTGEGDKIRIVPDAKTRRSIQSKENEIAKLKTLRDTLKAQKKFAIAKTKAQEIAKKEIALAKLKESAGIKLEQTTEGFKAKIAKIKDAIEFKESLRNDAISMIAAIPKELRAGFIKRASSVKTLKGTQKLAKEIESGVEKFERRVAIKDLNETVRKVESKINEIPSPQRERLIDIINSVSTKKIDVKARRGRKQLLGEDLQSLQKTTQRLASEMAGQLESLEPEVEEALRIPNERVRKLNLLTQKNANDISVEDIKFISESIKNVFHEAKIKSKLLVRKGLKPLEGALENAPSEVRSTKKAAKQAAQIARGEEVSPKKTNIQKLIEGTSKIARLDEMHSDTLVERITNPGATDVPLILDTLPHKGLRETAEQFNKWRKDAVKKFKELGFTDLDQLQEKHPVTLAGVKTEATLSELMSLEMDTRSADNLLQRLNSEGVQIGDKEVKYPKTATGEDAVDRLKEIRDAVAIVRQNKIAMAILDYAEGLNIRQAEAVNEMAKLRFGHEIAREKNYYPRSRVGDERVSGPKGKISIPPEKIGRYQQRTGGTKSLRLRPWHEVFLEGIESDAAFANMTLPLRNARILLNNKEFRDTMKASGREEELRNLTEIFANAQGITTSKDVVDVYSSFILKARTASALGFRISTRGTQIMSFYAAQAETGNQGAFVIKPYNKAAVERIAEDSALMDLRWESRRVGVEVGTSATDDAFDLLFFGKTKSLQNKGMKGLIKGDQQAIANIYYQLVVPEILNGPRNGKNVAPFEWEGQDVADLPQMNSADSEKFRYAAARRLEYVVRRTQPMFDSLDRSVSMASTNFFRRSFLMFRTALNAQANIVERAFIQLQKGEINKAQLIEKLGAVTASLTAVALWKRGLKYAIATASTALLSIFGVFQFKEPKEKKETIRDIVKDTAKGIASLNPATKVIAKAVEIAADKVAGDNYPWGREPVENPVLEVLNSGGDSAISISQVLADVGLLDEFVEEKTEADKKHNQMLTEKIAKDLVTAIKSSYNFGTTITGAPIQAPVQEFIEPLFKDSEIGIIKEVTFGDVDNPQEFSERIFSLYERRKELNRKSKTKRLTSNEERVLSVLNNFTSSMSSATRTLRETERHSVRKLRFAAVEMKLDSIENTLKRIDK